MCKDRTSWDKWGQENKIHKKHDITEMISNTKTFTLIFNRMIGICTGITSVYHLKVLMVIECMVEGGKAVKKEMIFNCFDFFCMFLNTTSCMEL
jgi:hypothetical protein